MVAMILVAPQQCVPFSISVAVVIPDDIIGWQFIYLTFATVNNAIAV